MKLVAAVLALATLMGCARSSITTQINGDGTWKRTVVLSGQEKKPGGMDMTPALEDVFVTPAEGWTRQEKTKASDRTVTFERTMAAGAALKGDLTLKGAEGAPPLLVNEVTVSRLAPKRFEYKETLRWSGPPPKNMGSDLKPGDLALIKDALPKPLATDENAKAVAEKAARLAVPMLFGPGDPLLALGLLHPDLAGRRLSQRMGALLMKALEDQFGAKLKPEERREVTRKLVETTLTQSMPSKPDPAAGPPGGGKNTGGLTPLMFVLKTPGKVMSSNGERDELTGEVFWALFPEAASLQPVVMTAVVEQ